jgi:hypothetical protein
MSTAISPASTPSSTFTRATSDEAADVAYLGDAIAELAARLHAATYELLVLLHRFDARHGWNDGFLSCAHWLHWRTGIALGASREKVRVARALPALPLVSAAMQRGELSYAKVRALTRIATPANEARLVAAARAGTAAHIERLVRAWRRVDHLHATRQSERRHLRRELVTWVDEDGMLVIRGRLAPEAGAVVQKALAAASDCLGRNAASPSPADNRPTDEITPAQRRADAMALLAERALDAGLDDGTATERYQVVVHVDARVLADQPVRSDDACPLATIDVGDEPVAVSAETSRRRAGEATHQLVRHPRDGTVLDLGRRTRSIPAALRRVLAARDGHCRFPGCTHRRCDGHHIRHWAHGGATRLDNLVLLCRRHHRAMHEEGYRVVRAAGGALVFLRPDGSILPTVPPPPRWANDDAAPLGPTNERMNAAGLSVAPYTPTAAWHGERFDVGWAVDVLRSGCDSETSA